MTYYYATGADEQALEIPPDALSHIGQLQFYVNLVVRGARPPVVEDGVLGPRTVAQVNAAGVLGLAIKVSTAEKQEKLKKYATALKTATQAEIAKNPAAWMKIARFVYECSVARVTEGNSGFDKAFAYLLGAAQSAAAKAGSAPPAAALATASGLPLARIIAPSQPPGRSPSGGSGLPSWALPAAIVGAGALFLAMRKK